MDEQHDMKIKTENDFDDFHPTARDSIRAWTACGCDSVTFTSSERAE
jgi:hypothetical protein